MKGLSLSAKSKGKSSPNLAIGAELWRSDLDFLRHELPRRHISPFHLISRENFEDGIVSLQEHAENQGSGARFVGLMHLLNQIGDGHTAVQLPLGRAYFPIEITDFQGDLRISRCSSEIPQAIGARIIAINDSPVDSVLSRALELTPFDENPSLRNSLATDYLTVGLILHGLGVIPNLSKARYTLQNERGTFGVELESQPSRNIRGWIRPYADPMLRDLNPDSSFWSTKIDDSKSIYCNFRGYENLGKNAKRLFMLIRDSKAEKLIVDLRDNGGGDYTKGERLLIVPIRNLKPINQKGHLFVLIGPRTFSAAMNNAAQFRTMTEAMLVGDTIGEKPNSYQEPRQMVLPNSHLIVRYSTRWYEFVKEGPNEVGPDVHIVPSWAQYSRGHDPVLEYALARGKE